MIFYDEAMIYIFFYYLFYIKANETSAWEGKIAGGGLKRWKLGFLIVPHTNTKVTSANAGLSSQMNVGTNSTGIHGLLLLLSPTDYTIQNKIMFTLMLELL